jgi:fermentation-respiration switch protein FrsA (DUF1100 family)
MSSDNSTSNNMREFTIPAAGGLAAVLHLPAGCGNGIAVVFCHGFRGSKEGGGRVLSVAAKVAELGFAALLFDFTPLGRLPEQVDELKTVVEYCRRNVSRRVILFGRSMGGSAALAVSAADRLIEGLCLWSAPHDLRETFRLSLGDKYHRLAAGGAITVADEFGVLNLTPDFLSDFDRFDLLACAGRLAGRPLLVVHGENDEIVPLRQAADLFAAAAEPKKIVVVPGGDHRFLSGHEQASAAVLAWLGDGFPRRPGP